METWKAVVGYEGLYEVSDLGQVRGLVRGKVLRPKKSTHPAPRKLVELYRDGKGSWKQIHCLVLEAFVGPRPPSMIGAHGDGDPANCSLGNLRWTTQKENVGDARKHGTLAAGSRHGKAKIHEGCVERMKDMRRSGCTVQSIADWFGLGRPQTGQILRGNAWAT